MAQNISINSTEGWLIADKTFPVGFSLSSFSTDSNGFEFESFDIADAQISANGNMAIWSKPSPINCTANLLPGSEDDKNMSILLKSNKISYGKISRLDILTLVLTYPDGTIATLSQGVLIGGTPLRSMTNEGKAAAKQYKMRFQDYDEYFKGV